MAEQSEHGAAPGPSLNRGLKSEIDTSHDVSRSPAPLETTGAREGQGWGWPLVWLATVIAGVALVIYFLV